MRFYPFLLLLLLVVGCESASPGREDPAHASLPASAEMEKQSPRYIDTLDFQAHPRYEISGVYQRSDTLVVVSGSSAVAYPLGKFETPKAFLTRYPGFTLTSELENPGNTGPVRVYTFTRGTNKVRMVKMSPGEEYDYGPWLDITSGLLTEPAIPLATGIHVGMTQRDVLAALFQSLHLEEAHPLRIIALTYVVDGQIQYCHLDQGVVTEIQLISDYTIK
ncbi:hypothetical protein GCM10023185_02420 [Hymenobacter saemangeumensis]|uniref:Uncharacterized protein n=1 Tax=Hymenobacter saemangeumensis TaxID=1084522 RepID=A0ABP8HYF3_9BACT